MLEIGTRMNNYVIFFAHLLLYNAVKRQFKVLLASDICRAHISVHFHFYKSYCDTESDAHLILKMRNIQKQIKFCL